MRRNVIVSIFMLSFFMGGSALYAQRVHVLPEPVMVKEMPGEFRLTPDVSFCIPGNKEALISTVKLFVDHLSQVTGFPLKIRDGVNARQKCVVLRLNQKPDSQIGDEGYQIKVRADGVDIRANKPAGIFYGLQTLMQLLPSEIESKEKVLHVSWNVPCVNITDYPRFKWRGLMLDVSRHFFSKEFVERYIDQMAKYKLNSFHWHLTDNQGWRIEIKGLPELTNIGAWRVPRTGKFGTFEPPAPEEKATDGGYYTQEDIKEVVRYAQERFVNIVPEVDVPGHSKAFIASYPDASCTGLQYPVNAGYSPDNDDIVLCAGNEDNFKKLEIIFSQIASLFPGKYIHIGGDEAWKDFWKKCPKCQQRMKDEGLKNEEELQSYFIKRVEKILLSKGKTLVGWDEILEGGLAPSAVVMSWRGTAGGIEAAQKGHDVVMSPNGYCYFNQPQGELAIERVNAGGSLISVSKAYEYEPVPDGVDAKYILGGQANLWAEFIPSPRMAEYMTWPRGLALSEVFWSPKEKRNWNDFAARMEMQFPRFEKEEVNYAPSVYDPTIVPIKDENGEMELTFSTELEDLDVYYTFDCTFPDNYSAKYQQKPVSIPKGASEIWVMTYRKDKPIGRLLVMGLNDLKSRLK